MYPPIAQLTQQADDSSRVHALNRPKPLEVEADANDLPRAVRTRAWRLKVEAIQDVWRIDDEWWREPISRRYFLIALEGGTMRTIYHDLVGGGWFEQRYG